MGFETYEKSISLVRKLRYNINLWVFQIHCFAKLKFDSLWKKLHNWRERKTCTIILYYNCLIYKILSLARDFVPGFNFGQRWIWVWYLWFSVLTLSCFIILLYIKWRPISRFLHFYNNPNKDRTRVLVRIVANKHANLLTRAPPNVFIDWTRNSSMLF